MHVNITCMLCDYLQVYACLFKGRKWWQEADEPWQVLACCIELSNALRSDDPNEFVSHIPIHQVFFVVMMYFNMCYTGWFV